MEKNTTKGSKQKISRKKFIGGAGLLTAGIILGETVRRFGKSSQIIGGKVESKNKWAMVIDLERCVGCNSCTIACKRENHTPPGVEYNIVRKEESGKYPTIQSGFMPRICMHCEKPACVEVCPVAATKKRPDGIVDIDYAKCIGCQKCIKACPYDARSFDDGKNYYNPPNEFEKQTFYEYDHQLTRDKKKSPLKNVVRKCHYCVHRIREGLKPACVESCMGKARFFGDLKDQNVRLMV